MATVLCYSRGDVGLKSLSWKRASHACLCLLHVCSRYERSIRNTLHIITTREGHSVGSVPGRLISRDFACSSAYFWDPLQLWKGGSIADWDAVDLQRHLESLKVKQPLCRDVWIKGTKSSVQLSNCKSCLGMFVLSKGGAGGRSPLATWETFTPLERQQEASRYTVAS